MVAPKAKSKGPARSGVRVALVQGAIVSREKGAHVCKVVRRLARTLGRDPSAEEFLTAAESDPILRTEFEWNDSLAAHRFRVQQARQILGSVRISWVHEGVEVHAPRYYAVKQDIDQMQYMRAEEALDKTQDQLIVAALAGLRHWYLRFGALGRRNPALQELVEFIGTRFPETVTNTKL